MKKHLLLLSGAFSFAVLQSNAQITITVADMPTAGTSIITADDSTFTGPSGATGAAQTWNYGGLQNHTTAANNFISSSGQQGASNFSGANLCIYSAVDSTWQYLTSNSNGLVFNGIYNTGSSFPLTIFKFDPYYEIIKLPTTYNSTSNNVCVSEFAFAYSSPPIDSVKGKNTVTQNSVMDAWGSVTTPQGTYNALRQKMVETSIDSSFYYAFGSWINSDVTYDTTTIYRWWANGAKFPVLEMSETPLNGITGASYLLSNAVSIEELAKNQNAVITYPNPTQSEINFSLPNEKANLEIYDLNGKLVYKMDTDGGIETIEISQYKNGIYRFMYIGNTGTLNGKFVVSH